MLDECRHFFGKLLVKRMLDLIGLPGIERRKPARRPAAPQPYIMLTVATSLTACTKIPPSEGRSLAMSSAPSVEGVIG